jgi:3-phenylpropionate/cinnamic acid dioxygenase small subunit
MTIDRDLIFDLFARYGALIDATRYDEWLDLFATECRYQVMPGENWRQGLPAALIFCDSRAMLEDRILALREANKYNIHTDRHLIGLPRIITAESAGALVEASFAVFQTDAEGESQLFATGLYRDTLVLESGALKIANKLVLLDTFAVPRLLASPL